MSARQILSIDVGTQSARALVFDAQGELLAKAQQVFAKTYESPQPGWAEQDPEIYWRAIVDCCQTLWRGGEVKRSEEHTSELQSLMRISYAVFCLKKKK